MAALIYDHRGKPVQLRELDEELAAPSIGSIRDPFPAQVCSGLTPAELASILSEAMQGDSERYLHMAVEIEARDLQYRTALGQRKAAVLTMQRGVHPASESAKDVQIAEELEEVITHRLLFDCLDAIGKGFACVEMIWETSEKQWKPTFKHRAAHYFRMHPDTGEEIRLRDLKDARIGVELAPFKWVLHEPRLISAHPLLAGLAYPVSAFHLFKSFGLKDWVIYAEVFGMPVRVGKYGAGATSKDIAALKRAVQMIGHDACAVISDSMSIDFVGNAGGAGSEVQENLVRYCDEQITKGVVGQTMTSDDGSSRAQAEVHERILEMYGEMDAIPLMETINRDVVAPYVRLNYGADVELPKFEMAMPENYDVEKFHSSIVPLARQGLRIPMRHVYAVTGVPEPEGDEPVLEPPSEPEQGSIPDDQKGAQGAKPAKGKGDKGEEKNAAQEGAEELNARVRRDVIERMAASLAEEWEPVMSSVELAMARLEHAFERGGADAVLEEIGAIEREGTVDGEQLLKRLATANFIARATGDATDSVR